MENPTHISQDEFERIERYLAGEMSGEERAVFETEMASNGTLRRHTEEIRIILAEVETSNLRQSMEQFHEALSETAVVPMQVVATKKTWWPWVAAASLALVLTLWVLQGRLSPNERMFTAFFEPDPGLVTAMSSTGAYEFDRAMVDYKTGNYQEAIVRWEKLLPAKPDNDTLNYFLGASYLAKGEADKAIGFFQNVAKMPKGEFTDDTYWFLSLAYLKQGKTEAAIEALNKSEHPSKDKLLQALREN